MQIRTKILPRSPTDFFVSLFVLIIIPVVYYFELFVVLPYYYPIWGPRYTFHFCTGTFILFNVCSNYIYVVLTDTSIRGRMLPTSPDSPNHFCSVCECIVPPRSWHCATCNVCILKRDHHCVFTSCCIGHDNQRYFFMFILYVFVATVYASMYNVFYAVNFVEFSWEAVVKIVFPLATLFFDFTRTQVYLAIVLIVCLGGVFTGALLVWHGDLILRGMVTYDKKNKNVGRYDLGVKENIVSVFGHRWYLTWLAPFVESVLPGDGVKWEERETGKDK